MKEYITRKHPEFEEMCKALGVEDWKSVHHLERENDRIYIPDEWKGAVK